METDEYEFSLLREVDVCNGHIQALEQALARFEERHGDGDERATLLENLERWRKRQREYQALLRAARTKE